MPQAPFSRGLTSIPRVISNPEAVEVGVKDARYVLTESYADLANAVLHPTVDSPSFAVRHDHGLDLTGLADDDHTQYHTDARGDARYLKAHLRLTVLDPVSAYATNPRICIVPKLPAAITITNIEVTCDADPATEVTGDLKYANTFIGLASPTVITAFDTTNGVFSSGAVTLAVAANKCLYLSFDTAPDAALKSITFDISYGE